MTHQPQSIDRMYNNKHKTEGLYLQSLILVRQTRKGVDWAWIKRELRKGNPVIVKYLHSHETKNNESKL